MNGPRPEGVCVKTLQCCHSEPFAVILSEAKDLTLGAQGKLREESRSEYFPLRARFLVACGSPESHVEIRRL